MGLYVHLNNLALDITWVQIFDALDRENCLYHFINQTVTPFQFV